MGSFGSEDRGPYMTSSNYNLRRKADVEEPPHFSLNTHINIHSQQRCMWTKGTKMPLTGVCSSQRA